LDRRFAARMIMNVLASCPPRIRRLILGLCIATAAVVTLASSPATRVASANPDGCWQDPHDPSPWFDAPRWGLPHYLSRSTMWCYAYRAGSVYNHQNTKPDGTGEVVWAPVGYLYASRSWFMCQLPFDDENPAVGSARNNWWLLTISDDAYDDRSGYGWFPATRVSGGGNYEPIPRLPDCRESPRPNAPGGEIGSGLGHYPIEAFARAGTRLTTETGVRFAIRLARPASVTVRIRRIGGAQAAAAGNRRHRVRVRTRGGWNQVNIDRLGRRRLPAGRYAVGIVARAPQVRSRTVKRSFRLH
jgi:hypothetical protein